MITDLRVEVTVITRLNLLGTYSSIPYVTQQLKKNHENPIVGRVVGVDYPLYRSLGSVVYSVNGYPLVSDYQSVIHSCCDQCRISFCQGLLRLFCHFPSSFLFVAPTENLHIYLTRGPHLI